MLEFDSAMWQEPPALRTISRGVSQQLGHLLVGGVLSQGAHDVGDLVVGHLVVAHPVEQTEGLPVVCGVKVTTMKLSSSNHFRTPCRSQDIACSSLSSLWYAAVALAAGGQQVATLTGERGGAVCMKGKTSL